MNSIHRNLLLSLTILFCLTANILNAAEQSQEYYEYRIYSVDNSENQTQVLTQLENNLLPALKRLSLHHIGVFTVAENTNDYSIHVLIPYPTLHAFSNLSTELAADEKYQKDSKAYFSHTKANPLYTRIESKLLKAFAGIPVIELPKESLDKSPRFFEIRTYESAHEKHAELKRHMFNHGETQLMRDLGMGPVFFGETLVGSDYPSLVYMLSSRDMEGNKAFWKKFKVSDGWKRMKVMPKYKGTVSKVRANEVFWHLNTFRI